MVWRRWAWLVLGGALLVPFGVLGSLAGSVLPDLGTRYVADAVVLVAVVLAGLPLAGLLPGVRLLEETATRELVGGPLTGLPRAGRGGARRAAAWFAGHLLAGALACAVTLGLPAGAAYLTEGAGPVAATAAALAAVALLYPLTAVAGRGIAALAPRFLGPSAADRVAELEREAAELAGRNRLARELHDSVGHALSIVAVQAGAAERVLDADPAFARRALGAIAETARDALADLDHALGVLRADGDAGRAPAPTLESLGDLVRRTRAGGVTVEAAADDAAGVPRAVSAEAYRIVQEGLTNAVKHAGGAPVTVRVAIGDGALTVAVANPVPHGAERAEERGPRDVGDRVGDRGERAEGRGPRDVGDRVGDRGERAEGRGLRGVAERVAALGGSSSAGPRDGEWRLDARLPLPPREVAR